MYASSLKQPAGAGTLHAVSIAQHRDNGYIVLLEDA